MATDYETPIRAFAHRISTIADLVDQLDGMLDDVTLTAQQKTVLKTYFKNQLQTVATDLQTFINGVS